MATFRLHDSRSLGSVPLVVAFWVNALTQERARALVARTFEPGSGDTSRWLDSALTICLPDRGQAVPSGVISLGSISCGD